eukprot:scaffold12179_cov43-Attheya_sp.AAC.1
MGGKRKHNLTRRSARTRAKLAAEAGPLALSTAVSSTEASTPLVDAAAASSSTVATAAPTEERAQTQSKGAICGWNYSSEEPAPSTISTTADSTEVATPSAAVTATSSAELGTQAGAKA